MTARDRLAALSPAELGEASARVLGAQRRRGQGGEGKTGEISRWRSRRKRSLEEVRHGGKGGGVARSHGTTRRCGSRAAPSSQQRRGRRSSGIAARVGADRI
ncbi:hypothetical protein PR202_ga08020 [Eleusine coracana subsp. coracana]|uniref:Uncharacterized protein n=1 Tax=Eleusine coracana subsp. coracana TaxID=191504 RepID=A0AAV5C136_ELECO|nr:hypothetical protein PR202_ga08020 [Eleusine coracana subsp. coracana]